jgi:hypothetical protein
MSSASSNERPDDGQTGLVVRGVDDYGVDLDGDGYFDQLVIEIEVNAPQPGIYWLQAELGVDHQAPTLVGTGGLIAASVVRADLAEGTQTVQLLFDASVDHYLSLEDIVVLGQITTGRLIQRAKINQKTLDAQGLSA